MYTNKRIISLLCTSISSIWIALLPIPVHAQFMTPYSASSIQGSTLQDAGRINAYGTLPSTSGLGYANQSGMAYGPQISSQNQQVNQHGAENSDPENGLSPEERKLLGLSEASDDQGKDPCKDSKTGNEVQSPEDRTNEAKDMTYGGGDQKKDKSDIEKKCIKKQNPSNNKSKTASATNKNSSASISIGSVITGHPKVISGDVISISGHNIHLAGISSPPLSEICRSGATTWRCGEDALSTLADALGNASVTCRISALPSDVTGKSNAEGVCSGSDGIKDLSTYQVSQGNALAISPHLKGAMFLAKSNRLGIWVTQ
ncbi:hypothetical protein NBRC3188_2952 [Acetobacter pasteurianus NBRC 3188]|uniref:Nuclease n=1 Tax=Acetobacter pasteurianus NBRC 3188 TaxID=1226663 RepID=A0A401WYA8_ACEPA|nr:hypothetical protein NBRC3188_2952 [Acetobacter pasteurianus NBRC 3188]